MPGDAAKILTRCGKLKVKKERSTYQAYKDFFVVGFIRISIYLYYLWYTYVYYMHTFFSSTFENLYGFVMYFSAAEAYSMLADRALCRDTGASHRTLIQSVISARWGQNLWSYWNANFTTPSLNDIKINKIQECRIKETSTAMTCVPNQWGPPDWCRSPIGDEYRSTALRWLVPKKGSEVGTESRFLLK